MTSKKLRKVLGLVVAANMVFSNGMAYAMNQNGNGSEKHAAESNSSVLKVNMNEDGLVDYDLDNSSNSLENKKFSWDNASVYFTITDRFKNGDTSNDHAYRRSVGEVDADNYQNRQGTFHGGDLKGLKEKVDDGYFDKLGINAIWITAPYEQIHGALCGEGYKHYAFHGYYTLDYTNVDGNMGTAEDLHNFIDTAHSHGIRVIFDVVMNHAGYADPVTMDEYGFGGLVSNWRDIYYNRPETSYRWYNDYERHAAENGAQGQGMMKYDADWTTNWWGPDWIRAITERFKGYEGIEDRGSELTYCSKGLPDFKTESQNPVSIPGILRTKWQREGRYYQEVTELNEFFNRTGKPRIVKNYLIKWLSDWVREYGIDGFRCDTAKHVTKDCWGDLKTECVSALNEWRKNNPDKPGAAWKDNFWMTGEDYGHGVGKDDYFYTGKFDSMINFDYKNKGCVFLKGSQIDGTYAEYAGKVNNDDNFNVLSYMSSHDEKLSRGGDMITAGTNLLLLPGGVQTFYGDETNRQAIGSNAEQACRSEMNWNSIDQRVLSHWQKVGSFRSNHIAVGAGTHTKISEAPYTFSRVYNKKGINDKVVVSEPGKSGNCTVSVRNVFSDDEKLRDAYTGKEYIVSNGSVNVDAGENGVVLLESTEVNKASVGVAPGSKEYYTDSVKVTLSANNVSSATYSVDGVNKGTFENGQEIEVGQDKEEGETTTVKVSGVDKEGKEIKSQKAVYTKIPKPKCLTIHVKNDSYKSAPNVYVYSADGAAVTKYTGAWPGAAMIEESDGWYTLDVDNTISGKVIFNGSWGQYPSGEGLELEGEVWILNNQIINKPDLGEEGTVNVKYVDSKTGREIISASKVKGKVGEEYKVTPKDIKGYKLVEESDNSTGTFTKEGTTVTYKYIKDETVKDTLIIHVKNDRWTSAPNIYIYGEEGANTVQYTGSWPGKTMTSEGDGWYTFSTDETISGKIIFNGPWGQYPGSRQPGLDVSGEVWILNNEIIDNPNKMGEVNVKYIDADTLQPIEEADTLTGKVGESYTTYAKDIKGYELVSESSNVSGKYEDEKTTVIYKYKKVVEKVKINDISVIDTVNSVQLSAETNKDEGVTYGFWTFTPDGKWELIEESSSNKVNWIPSLKGKYILWVYVKDSEGNTDYKSVEYTFSREYNINSVIEENNSKIIYKGLRNT